MRILYEDCYLLAAEKPAGLLSQPDASGDPDLLSELRAAQTAAGDRYPAQAIHRLDRGTGGVIVYAKGSGIAAKLSALLRDRAVHKEYLAVVCGRPDRPEGEWRDLLLHDARRNFTSAVAPGTPGALEAVLRYRVLGEATEDGLPLTLVRVTLLTGRTHQIRAQFASRGLPLYGDGKYGAKTGGAMGLFAWHLSFTHPMNRREQVSVSCLPPREGVWHFFPETEFPEN